ncbi:conserved hypothetical protein [delta proteobacterium NaphS2]|nr:conserved hypothetical protein [delta proteobacterium NaphS2]
MAKKNHKEMPPTWRKRLHGSIAIKSGFGLRNTVFLQNRLLAEN